MPVNATENSNGKVLSPVPGGFLHVPGSSGEWAITSRKGIPPIFPTRELGLERATGGKAKLIHARALPAVATFSTPWHKHLGDSQVLYVLGGSMTTTFSDGSSFEIRQGDAAYTEGPHWHTHHSFAADYEVLEMISPPGTETVESPDGPPAPGPGAEESATWVRRGAEDPYLGEGGDSSFGFRDLGSHPVGDGLLAVRIGRPTSTTECPWPATAGAGVTVVVEGSARLRGAAEEPLSLAASDAIYLDAGAAAGFELDQITNDFRVVQVSETAPAMTASNEIRRDV